MAILQGFRSMQSFVGCPSSLTFRFVLKTLGCFVVARSCLKLLRNAWNFLRPAADLRRRYGAYGRWAVVTGGSDGIGKAMARELAVVHGFHVCLIARNAEKLKAAATEIEQQSEFRVEVRTVVFDFAASQDDKAWRQLVDHLPDDVAIVVNNVGMRQAAPGPLDDPDRAASVDLASLHVNCLSTLRMCKTFVPLMKARGGGAIINISSLNAVFGRLPFQATYAATKAFVRVLSRSLDLELREHNIDVLTLTPGFVISGMTKQLLGDYVKETFSTVAAREMASQSLAQIGRASETAGHVRHQLFRWWYLNFPDALFDVGLMSRMKTWGRRGRAGDASPAEEGARGDTGNVTASTR